MLVLTGMAMLLSRRAGRKCARQKAKSPWRVVPEASKGANPPSCAAGRVMMRPAACGGRVYSIGRVILVTSVPRLQLLFAAKRARIVVAATPMSSEEAQRGTARLSGRPVLCKLGCGEEDMTANLSLHPELIERSLAVSGERARKAAVTRALEEFIARRRQRSLLDQMGKLEWNDWFNCWHGHLAELTA
jgi:hypothetical protein